MSEPAGVSHWALRPAALQDGLEKACQTLGFLPKGRDVQPSISFDLSDDEEQTELSIITTPADEGKAFLAMSTPHSVQNFHSAIEGSLHLTDLPRYPFI